MDIKTQTEFMFRLMTTMGTPNKKPKLTKDNMVKIFDEVFIDYDKYGDEIEYACEHMLQYISHEHVANLISEPNCIACGFKVMERKFNNTADATDVLECLMEHEFSMDTFVILIDSFKADPNGKFGLLFVKACKYGHYDAVKTFIDKYHVDVNTRDNNALMFALRFEKLKVARLLIENGADVHAKHGMPLKLINKLPQAEGDEDYKWLLNYRCSLVEKTTL